MKTVPIVTGLVLAGLIIWGVGNAAAANTWLISGAATTGQVSVDGEWTLIFEDMGTGVKIECPGTSEGTVETGGKDQEATVTENLAACKTLAGSGTCKKILAVKFIDLPWSTQISGERDQITESGAGAPGWLLECEALLGIKIDDTCTLASGSTLLINNEDGILESEADEGSGEGNCSVGGEGAWLVVGTTFWLTLEGLSLTFS